MGEMRDDRGMMKRAILIVALGGCATPYQRMGVSGGYDDKRLPNGDYIVTVKVNGFTDRATALEYLHRRADELCPGGYQIIDRADDDNGDFRTGSKPEVDGVVRCKTAVREPKQVAKPAAVTQPTPPSPRGFFCSTSSSVNFCVRDKDECIRTRDISIATAPDLTACTLVESAWCYGDRCLTTQETCDAQSAKAGGLACAEVR